MLEVGLISFPNTTIFPESLNSMSSNSPLMQKSRTSRYTLISTLGEKLLTYFTQVHGGNERLKPKENNGITLNKILQTAPETSFRKIPSV